MQQASGWHPSSIVAIHAEKRARISSVKSGVVLLETAAGTCFLLKSLYDELHTDITKICFKRC